MDDLERVRKAVRVLTQREMNDQETDDWRTWILANLLLPGERLFERNGEVVLERD